MPCHGSILNNNSYGTNELIKQGAIPVTCIDDFLNLWNNKDEKTKERGNNGRNKRNRSTKS